MCNLMLSILVGFAVVGNLVHQIDRRRCLEFHPSVRLLHLTQVMVVDWELIELSYSLRQQADTGVAGLSRAPPLGLALLFRA